MTRAVQQVNNSKQKRLQLAVKKQAQCLIIIFKLDICMKPLEVTYMALSQILIISMLDLGMSMANT